LGKSCRPDVRELDDAIGQRAASSTKTSVCFLSRWISSRRQLVTGTALEVSWRASYWGPPLVFPSARAICVTGPPSSVSHAVERVALAAAGIDTALFRKNDATRDGVFGEEKSRGEKIVIRPVLILFPT
jgi:hypothetical protein